MNASTNLSAAVPSPSPLPSPEPPELLSQEPCGVFFPEDCVRSPLNTEDRFLALVVVSLAVIAVALCVLACMLTVLVHKLSTIWVRSMLRPAPTTEPSDDPRKGLLHETKSSLRGSSSSSDKAGGKKKKASFSEDTSCAAPRDVDEEDL
jgi:hypothetical protein